MVAALIRRFRDFDLAEEAAQDAFTEALARWRRDGLPANPGAWLTTVARNRVLDRLRRRKAEAARLNRAATLLESEPEADAPEPDDPATASGVADDRLRLIFTCCHPALRLEARVALTLRTLAGLTTAEIARAFLVPEDTMSKRLVRAKHKIKAAGIPYRVPSARLLPERLSGVLAVVYLLFNEGYAASAGADLVRHSLCDEAIRLARMLVGLMPADPEVLGLTALLMFQDSRRPARTGPDGELATLEQQDRTLWDRSRIEEGKALLAATRELGRVGPYQLQAAIAACHAIAPTAAETNRRRIVLLYDRLVELVPSAVVRLNRAVAVAMADGPEAALPLLDELADEGSLRTYHLLPATRADLLRRLGRLDEAIPAYRTALALAPTEAERRFLTHRLAELADKVKPSAASDGP